MVLTRLLLCLGIAFCAAQDASCEHTSLIQDHASHAGQRLKTEEKTEKTDSPGKDADADAKKIDQIRPSLVQESSASASKTSESDAQNAEKAEKAMADWIARDFF